MPGYGFCAAGFLDEEFNRPDQQVRAEYVFDHIEDTVGAGKICQQRDHELSVHAEELRQVAVSDPLGMMRF